MKHRLLSMLLAVALVLGLAGCGQGAKTPEEYLDLGTRFLSEGKYEDAVLAFTALLEIEPNYAAGLKGRGQALQKLGGEENLTAARSDFESAVALDAEDMDLRFLLTDLLLELGATDDAKDVLAQTYSDFGSSDELTARMDQLESSGSLEGEDLTRYGIAPPTVNVADMQAGHLSQEDTDAIVELLDYLNQISRPAYDCTASNAESRALDLTLFPYFSLYEYFFSQDEIRESMDAFVLDQLLDLPATDPLGQFPVMQAASINAALYRAAPMVHVDWVLQNIFNVQPQHPSSAVSFQTIGEMAGTQSYYCYGDDYYYSYPALGGRGYPITSPVLQEVRQYEDFVYADFRVEYYDYGDDPDSEEDQPMRTDDFWVLLQKKQVDGSTEWAICYFDEQPLTEITRFLPANPG